ncbi:NAD(P)/FAD-dependent oxidoreductase [Kribbella solani]|uniref:3-phenylpropionate/trans-cinnamate dioxygenase ferredoxin reductase subunit n=1 Tax=Kribbella solani TaxID=236067 RepID=A0A841DN45_9ACTN|nr:FAD-dependent oxidoreductase [Kribbella solani]MBB5980554.1 3-phenylpropionate/trans-cinnamate dioxygenase ferredoxin reductase subunit [Kribbella solani]
MRATYVIAGAGLPGARAAQALREHGFAGRIVLIGDETTGPYERPALSNGYLLGKDERTKVFVHERRWHVAREVELRLGERVVSIDRAAHEVELSTGERIAYTKLLLATGASPRRVGLPGADLDGVHDLRWAADSDRLRETILDGGRIVVVGAGWTGLETAAAAREYGCDVTIVDSRRTLLDDALGTEMGAYFAGLHSRHGVDLQLGRTVRGFGGTSEVSSVLTDDGGEFAADAVIVAARAVPNVELAQRAGLACDDGVLVDEALRTEDPDIYAIGEVASSYSPFYQRHLRTEHWSNALHCAPVVAQSMLGRHVGYDRLPYFSTEQYEAEMEFTGRIGPEGYDRVVIRGDISAESFQAFWLTDDKVVAGLHVNLWESGLEPIEDLIRSHHPVDPTLLADPTVPPTTFATTS